MEGDDSVDVEVTGTHLGLIANSKVYETIARALAGVGTGGTDSSHELSGVA